MHQMKHGFWTYLICGCLAAAPATAQASDNGAAQDFAARGMAAAAAFPGYASLCNLESRMRNVNLPRKPRANTGAQNPRSEGQTRERPAGRAGGGRPQAAPIAPVQVFDNLYFLGTGSVSSWLYGTADGYILIDGLNTDEEAEDYILGGMKALGLDPSAIEHLLVTHGHGDHYGGADYISEKLGIPVTMSAPDWDLVATLGVHPRFGPPPQKGLTVADGDVLQAGETTLTVHLTPGHTPGTISPVFELTDQGQPHKALIWGGTGFNFGPDVGIFETYAASAQKMRGIAEAQGVDVFLSNHTTRDGSGALLRALTSGGEASAQSFVRGKDGMALFAVLENCALAQAERFRTPAE